MKRIIQTREEAERYNNSPMYKDEIAAGMIPFIIGDPAPEYDDEKIPYTRKWYKAQKAIMATTKKQYN